MKTRAWTCTSPDSTSTSTTEYQRRKSKKKKRKKRPRGNNSQSNAHCATSNFQGAALWPGLRSGELAGFGKSHFPTFGFWRQVPFPPEAEQQDHPFLLLQQQPTAKVESFCKISKTKQEQLGLPCHTTPRYLPHYTSHPECHDLMHAMNWTDGLPITTSVVKILKNVTQESVDLKS